jgi:hypothetical protein
MVVAGRARGPALTGARRFPPPWTVEELDACVNAMAYEPTGEDPADFHRATVR